MVGLGRRDGSGQTGHDALVGQRFHDDAGGKRQHLLRLDVELLGQSRAHRLGIQQTLRTGASIGHPGVDHQCTNGLATGQMRAAQLHGRGTKTVLGEHTGHGSARVEQKHGEVFAVGFAHARLHHTDAQTSHRMQITGLGGQ